MEQIRYAVTDPSNVDDIRNAEIFFGDELWENARFQLEAEAMNRLEDEVMGDWYKLLVESEREQYA